MNLDEEETEAADMDDSEETTAEDTACYVGTVIDVCSLSGETSIFQISNSSGTHKLKWVPGSDEPDLKVGERVGLWGWYFPHNMNVGYACEVERDLAPRLDLVPAEPFTEVAREALRRLVSALSEVTFVPLVDFVNDTLGRREVYDPFFTRPASRACHHDWVGGLAVHTAEVVQNVRSLPLDQFSSPLARECALVAAMVQDVGKTQLYGDGFANSCIAHETRGIKILGSALMNLQAADKNVGEFIEMLLDPSKHGRGNCPEKVILSLADRVSASADASRKAFSETPAWQSAAKLPLNGKSLLFFRPIAGRMRAMKRP